MRASKPDESTMHARNSRLPVIALLLAAVLAAAEPAHAQSDDDEKLARAADVLRNFTADDDRSIPADLLARARGIVVIPTLVRGGFIIGGRRGRGVMAVRSTSGEWSNPAFVTLTGGSMGFQFGAEAADVVLVFGNDRSIRHISDGKFTLGGDATAVAGPLGRRTTAAVTGKAEVYIYTHSKGLFAGAAFEGARLDVDEEGNAVFYRGDERAALSPPSGNTPSSAAQFLQTLSGVTSASFALAPPRGGPIHPGANRESESSADEAIIYPIEDGSP
jgi:lipid-binding SYLF domain-containing protein